MEWGSEQMLYCGVPLSSLLPFLNSYLHFNALLKLKLESITLVEFLILILK